MRSRAAALALGAALAGLSVGACGVKGPPRPAGAPERPAPAAPKDTISAAPPAAPVTPSTEAAR